MAIIPTVRCRNIRSSIAFYTGILDFERVGDEEPTNDPTFAAVRRGGDVLYLSSHRGDGEYGQAIVIEVDDVDEVFRALLRRGLKTPGNPDSPVHEGPVDQTWGTRELYVDDPDGNTLRFQQQGGSPRYGRGPAMQIIYPLLRYNDARSAIRWLCDAFGFVELFSVPPEGRQVRHAQLGLGTNVIMVGSVRRDDGMASPKTLGAATQGLYVCVKDVDAHYERARAAGAAITSAPEDTDFGSRDYHCSDLEGHPWTFGTYRPDAGGEDLE